MCAWNTRTAVEHTRNWFCALNHYMSFKGMVYVNMHIMDTFIYVSIMRTLGVFWKYLLVIHYLDLGGSTYNFKYSAHDHCYKHRIHSTNYVVGSFWSFAENWCWSNLAISHYIDVIMTTMASQITSLTVVYSTVYSDADQRKHQSSASLVFVWGIRRNRWIPRTKGQLRGKGFHLMTSSCFEATSQKEYVIAPWGIWAHVFHETTRPYTITLIKQIKRNPCIYLWGIFRG